MSFFFLEVNTVGWEVTGDIFVAPSRQGGHVSVVPPRSVLPPQHSRVGRVKKMVPGRLRVILNGAVPIHAEPATYVDGVVAEIDSFSCAVDPRPLTEATEKEGVLLCIGERREYLLACTMEEFWNTLRAGETK